MSNQPFYRAFPLFCNAIADSLISRNSFNPKWFISESGVKRMTQVFNEGMPFDISVSELETWCKGWTSQNNEEQTSPLKLAASVTTINA